MINSELPPHELVITQTATGPIRSREIDIAHLGPIEKIDLTASLVNNPEISSIWLEGMGIEQVFDRTKINNPLTVKDKVGILKKLNIKLPQAKRLSAIEMPTSRVKKRYFETIHQNPTEQDVIREIFNNSDVLDVELKRIITDASTGRILETGTIRPFQMTRHESLDQIDSYVNSFSNHSNDVIVFLHIQNGK